VWKEIRRHLLNPELLLKAQSLFRNGGSVDESFLSAQLNHASKRLSQLQGERHRLLDAFQGGFVDKEEFEQRAAQILNRIRELEADIRGLEDENKHLSEGNNSSPGFETSRMPSPGGSTICPFKISKLWSER
jgi:hypothetical protein